MSTSPNGAARPGDPASPVTDVARSDASLLESGTFADVPLPRLLLDLYRTGFNGSLDLSRDRTTKRFVFQRGAPVLSESNLPSETLGVQLVDAGVISQAEHAKISAYMQKKRCREGVALLALKLIDAKQLFQALKDQVRRRLIEAFAWSKGSFQLSSEDMGKVEIQPFRSDPFQLVREGLGAHWSADQILGELMTQMERYPQPSAKFEDARRRLGGDPQVDAFLAAIDGHRMLGEAIGSGLNNPPVLATAWVLVAARLVQLQEEPPGAQSAPEHDFLDSDIEIEIAALEGSSNPEQASRSGPERAAAESAAAQGSQKRTMDRDKAAQLMRQEVLERLQNLEDLSHYELLGVPSDANTGAIRKAYFSAAKRYHPDALARMGLNDIKEEANTVFSRIAEANEVLSDAEKRRNYNAALMDVEPELDVNALAQAETLYRKSEILVRMGDFRGALEFLRPCVELWPEECAYRSALGWALYKQPQPEPDAAREHLEHAVTLGTDDAVAHFRLGVLLRALGDSQRSAELLARARMLDPKVS